MKNLLWIFSLLCFSLLLQGQLTIQPLPGYSEHIGFTVGMLEDLKGRVTQSVKGLTMEEADFLLDEDANRIGALILHLAATEKYYQVYTFENRQFNEEESKIWGVPLKLGQKAREVLKGKSVSYYLDICNEVRKETLTLLGNKDDEWFNTIIPGNAMNNHWAWYHVMEHQANHMGQIRLIINRLP